MSQNLSITHGPAAMELYHRKEQPRCFIELSSDHEAKPLLELLMLSMGVHTLAALDRAACTFDVLGERGDEIDRFIILSGFRPAASLKEQARYAAIRLAFTQTDKAYEAPMDEDPDDVLVQHTAYNYSVNVEGPYQYAVRCMMAALLTDANPYQYVAKTLNTSKQQGPHDPSGCLSFLFRNPSAFYKNVLVSYDHQVFIDDLAYLKTIAK